MEGEEVVLQRGFLSCIGVPFYEYPHQAIYTDLCDVANRWLVRTCFRATLRQSNHPAQRRIHWTGIEKGAGHPIAVRNFLAI